MKHAFETMGLCKYYGTRILVSDNTIRRLRGRYTTREVDRVVVKGKTEAVAIHEVLDYHTPQTFPRLSEAVSTFNEGLLQYRAQSWDRAALLFRKVLAMNPHDLSDAHYRLARAYFGVGDRALSREHLLYALEIAPGFREAQQLLLEIVR